jgi:cytochrome c553
MLSRCVSTIIAAGFAAVLAAPAQAQGTQPGTQPTPPTPADIEAKAQMCAACHGANGTPLDPKTMPNIWGQQPYYILTQLVHYRNGMRENPVMASIAKTLQQSDLRPLAAYFAAKPWPAASNTPPAPAETPKGLTMCTPCHQANFQGGISWPRVAGLNYDYMVAAMRSFANEERTNNMDMVKIMKLFSDSERDAMARYLAALK